MAIVTEGPLGTTYEFDPDDTSDVELIIPSCSSVRIELAGGIAHYADDDEVFAGAPYVEGFLTLATTTSDLRAGDHLRFRLGGHGRGQLGGFNGGGSSPVGATGTHYGLGGGGCTEVWRNGELWAVAGGGPGGFRRDPDINQGAGADWLIDWFTDGATPIPGIPAEFGELWALSNMLRPHGAPRPGPTEQLRVPAPMIDQEVDDLDLHYEATRVTAGGTGGEHDGADGVLNPTWVAARDGLPYAYTTGAGGGGYGGGASGGFASYLTIESELSYLDYWLWNIGKPGGYLLPSGNLTAPILVGASERGGAVGLTFYDANRPISSMGKMSS